MYLFYRRLRYGPVCKMYFLHHVLILVTCPNATKVHTAPYRRFVCIVGQTSWGGFLFLVNRCDESHEQFMFISLFFLILFLFFMMIFSPLFIPGSLDVAKIFQRHFPA